MHLVRGWHLHCRKENTISFTIPFTFLFQFHSVRVLSINKYFLKKYHLIQKKVLFQLSFSSIRSVLQHCLQHLCFNYGRTKKRRQRNYHNFWKHYFRLYYPRKMFWIAIVFESDYSLQAISIPLKPLKLQQTLLTFYFNVSLFIYNNKTYFKL